MAAVTSAPDVLDPDLVGEVESRIDAGVPLHRVEQFIYALHLEQAQRNRLIEWAWAWKTTKKGGPA